MLPHDGNHKTDDDRSQPPHGLDGASIDGGLYTEVTDFAHRTHWLNGPVSAFTTYGVALFGVFLLAGWWLARRRDARTMAAALIAPVAVVIAYVVNDSIKSVFQEARPCRALPHDFLIEACPPANDYAFPSNHTTVAFAAAAALFLVNRRLGAVATITAVLMGASRVYVGAHYPPMTSSSRQSSASPWPPRSPCSPAASPPRRWPGCASDACTRC
ncbi:hypothetical protein GCM10020000_75870 [Streptomyces olivoverticillatus]